MKGFPRRSSAHPDGTRATHRGLLLAATLAALAGASVFLLSGALSAGAATPCAGSVLPGSNFEIDTNANLVVDGQADCIDWLADGSGSALRAGVLTKSDKPTGATDDSFGQGTQENDANPTIVDGSIPPNKSDLKTFGVYKDTTATAKYLELFWSRVQNPSGTTNMDFELNQKTCDPAATPTNCANNGVGVTPETPLRTTGDKLITYDLSNGGTVPTISIRTWTGAAWGPAIDMTASGQALGSVNTTAIAAADAGSVGALDAFTFGEAAIAFDAIFPNPSECGSLGSVYVKSRSSDSFQSEIKDYNSGNFTPTVTGTYLWTAAYTGDQHNKGSSTACKDANESSTVEKATPTLTTNASGPVIVGQNIHDTAHLSAGFGTLGGQITFEVFAPGDTTCQTPISVPPAKPVSGANDYTSGDFTTSAVGTYRWIAHYSGDANNNAVNTKCNDANENVQVIGPHITILKTPDQQTIVSGQTASFTIQVINDGDSNLSNVVVTDALAPGCARTSADIAGLALMKPAPDPSGTITYTCTLANVTASFTNTAAATGTPPVGPPVSSQDTAAVTVVQPVTHPAISIVKDPKSQTVTVGNTATFTITVLNTGDTTLTDVAVTDALSPNCNKTIGTLAPGASVSYKCTRPNVRSSFTNVAVVTGKAGGTTLTAQDTAPVTAKKAFVPKKIVPKVVSHKKPKATG